MSSKQPPTTPLSDERKRKRMVSNRESARRSRLRKQQQLGDLSLQMTQLEEENKKVREMIDGASELYINFASDNNVLRATVAELTDRLRSLNSVLQIASEVSGMVLDIPDVPDNLLEPWQLPCPVHPISASADMFNY